MEKTKSLWRARIFVLGVLAISLICIQMVNTLTGYRLNYLGGLYPRHLSGLVGIIFAPWLHGSWSHLFSNLPVLLVLSTMAMLGSIRQYFLVSAVIIVGSGVLVWVLGRNSIHVGASGWIFGLWAWLLFRGIFQRNTSNILTAIAVFFLYGGIWIGFLPEEGVSFEGHIAGAVCGAFIAYVCRDKQKRTRIYQ